MKEILALIVQIGSISTASITLLTALFTRTVPWLRAKIAGRSIAKYLDTEVSAERSIRYYIEPHCQDLDPAGAEEPRLALGVKQRLFETLDQALDSDSEYRYIILLADSGMGKSSALINYCARHLRRIRKPYKIALIPLGMADADHRIGKVEDKKNTVLFLDALDEDVLAIADHAERLEILLSETRDFRRIIITCRTQFFPKDEEIPTKTGVLKLGSRSAGEPAEHYFHKLYLSPFSDNEVERYVRRRYPWWKINKRRATRRIVKKIPNLIARPMLLSHIDVLLNRSRNIHFPFELYEELVRAWIDREKGYISSAPVLRQFSEQLAVVLFLLKDRRGSERASADEVLKLAKEWNINLDSWQLTGRSLLNRDAEGNYKFAHRSIMEYLYVSSFRRGAMHCLNSSWTDQMESFFWQMIERSVREIAMADPASSLEFTTSIEKSVAAYLRERVESLGVAWLGDRFDSLIDSTLDLTPMVRYSAMLALVVAAHINNSVKITALEKGVSGGFRLTIFESHISGVLRTAHEPSKILLADSLKITFYNVSCYCDFASLDDFSKIENLPLNRIIPVR